MLFSPFPLFTFRLLGQPSDPETAPLVPARYAGDTTLPNGMNDDADETTRDSRLVYTLPADGQYVIAVTRFGVRDGTTTGDFRLNLNKVN